VTTQLLTENLVEYETEGLEPQHGEEHFPLLHRGWVLQERTLSPRTLFFSRQEVLWECRSEEACQCGYGTFDEQLDEHFKVLAYPAI
jgi:hypothetical protein